MRHSAAASISLLLAENRDIIAGQESHEKERRAKFGRFIAGAQKRSKMPLRPCTYDVGKVFGFLLPLTAIGNNLHKIFHAALVTLSVFFGAPSPRTCHKRHMCMLPLMMMAKQRSMHKLMR